MITLIPQLFLNLKSAYILVLIYPEDEALAREIALNGIDGLTPNSLNGNDPYPELQEEIRRAKEQKQKEGAQDNGDSSYQQAQENLA